MLNLKTLLTPNLAVQIIFKQVTAYLKKDNNRLGFLRCLIIGFVLIVFGNTYAVAYSIEESMHRTSKDLVGKSKNQKAKPPKEAFNGYKMLNKKDEVVGYVSKNQRCVFVGNYTEGNPASYSSELNIEHLNFKCGGSRK